jgi:hypothetical protein
MELKMEKKVFYLVVAIVLFSFLLISGGFLDPARIIIDNKIMINKPPFYRYVNYSHKNKCWFGFNCEESIELLYSEDFLFVSRWFRDGISVTIKKPQETDFFLAERLSEVPPSTLDECKVKIPSNKDKKDYSYVLLHRYPYEIGISGENSHKIASLIKQICSNVNLGQEKGYIR